MTGAQKKKIRRIMIAAPKSGSGKTTITCGLLQIFKENGEDISSCKCGPDYIDPMFHRQVLGVPSRNLDTFFTGEEGTRKLFLKDRREDELVVKVLWDCMTGWAASGRKDPPIIWQR